MSQNEVKILTGWIGILLFVLFLVSLLGCDGGWSIGGWEVK
jgi:hypothetical protein